MKYLCLVYSEEAKLAGFPDEECVAHDSSLRQRGLCLASEALQPVRTATTVRVRDGKVSVTDGPFAETKEQLAGFYLVDARDLDEAIELAARIPPARIGCIELRPIRQLPGRADPDAR
ncbi:MAG: YciI family protein [Woeseiaceae bacterium]